MVERVLARRPAAAALADMPQIAADHIVQIAFTSGSTGTPTSHAKRWGSLHFNTRFNAERIRECLGIDQAAAPTNIIATVPPQHMYGTETSVLLPLLAGMAVHGARPLFPGDVAVALAEAPDTARAGDHARASAHAAGLDPGLSDRRGRGVGHGADGCGARAEGRRPD